MSNLSSFCTCKDTGCPFHPTNHGKGCAPCIRKNLRQKEIPSCFFNLVADNNKRTGYTFEDFAKLIVAKSQF